MMTDTELETHYAWIRWRDPLTVVPMGEGSPRLGCRFCIAQKGLTSEAIPTLPATRAEFDEHMRKFHTP